MARKEKTSVVIVGGGPCGLMLAIELGRRQVPTILLDDKPDTSPHPQANATQARTMEHYRRLGFADAVRAEGLPADYPTDIAYFTRYTGHELARFALPPARHAKDKAEFDQFMADRSRRPEDPDPDTNPDLAPQPQA